MHCRSAGVLKRESLCSILLHFSKPIHKSLCFFCVVSCCTKHAMRVLKIHRIAADDVVLVLVSKITRLLFYAFSNELNEKWIVKKYAQ